MTIDIVIPTHDGKYLDLCVRSVEQFTKNPHRIIVVDSASESPETHKVLAGVRARGHTVVSLGSNESFSKAINAGLNASKAEYVSLLNDDAVVLDGWDAIMVADLADSRVGMTGATMPGAAAGFQGNPEFAQVLRVPYLVFAHVMLRRDVLDKVGGLDAATFDGFGSEDLDYSWRVVKEGYRLKVSQARTLHVGGATMERNGGAGGRGREYDRMHRKLVDKWGKEHVAENTRLFPRVSMCIPTYNGKVDNDFFQSCMALQKTGPFEVEIFQTKRIVVHYARERIVEAVLKAGHFDYIWWLDDDMTFPPDTLARLLAHRKPVVTAVAYQRREPYAPCIFDWSPLPKHEQGAVAKSIAEVGGFYEHVHNAEHTGLRKIDGCGSACTLVATSVYKQLDASGKRPFYSNKSFGEDLYFTRLCNEAGIPIYADTDLIIGHLGDPVLVDEGHVARYKAHKAQQAGQLAAGGYAR